MKKTKIILADDHAILRTGLKLLLSNEESVEVVGEASNGNEVLELTEKIPADVLILDLSMPGVHGLDVIKELKEHNNPINILVLTMHSEEQYIKTAMEAGASGYLEKSAFDTELLTAVKTVAAGKIYLNNQHALLMVNSLLNNTSEETKEKDPYVLLSKREIEVLKLFVRGYSLYEIGKMLSLSLKTIDTYKTRIFVKLGLTKKSELVQYALEHGILTADDNDMPTLD